MEENNTNQPQDSSEEILEEEEETSKKHFPTPGKKIWKWILVIAVALTAGWFFFLRPQSTSKQDETEASVRTITLTKGSLENTVTANGTVSSQDTSIVTTELKYTVKSIEVEVGDTVQKGDTIVILNTSDLETQIARREKSDAETLKNLQKALQDATYSKDAAYTTMSEAKTTLDNANTEKNDACNAYNVAASRVTSYQTAYDNAETQLNVATAEVNRLNSLCTDSLGNATQCSAANADTSTTQYNDWTTYNTGTYAQAQTLETQAMADLMNAKTNAGNVDTLATTCNAATQSADQAQTQYNQAAQNFNTVNAKFFDAQDALNEGVSDDDLADLRQDLADCTLKAETSGTVTAINATVGSIVSGTVATISSTNQLQIVIAVDEYDIQSIQKGMSAIITSDAIGQSLSGTVTNVSPVASVSTSGQTSSSFSVTVSIDGYTDALLIGMSAEVKIILSSTGDVYTVPIDAVGVDESGNSVIYVRNADNTFDPVIVTTGESNDYYIEIEGASLKDGMIVRASADPDAAIIKTAEPTPDYGDMNFQVEEDGGNGGRPNQSGPQGPGAGGNQ